MSLLSFYWENYQGNRVFANTVVKGQILNGTCPGEWLCFLEELFLEKQTFRSMINIDSFFKQINLLPFNMMALIFKVQNESLQKKNMERLADLIMKSCKVMLGW